ncbi:hypothetical protein IFM89_022246, partial [Coptis chinensis]
GLSFFLTFHFLRSLLVSSSAYKCVCVVMESVEKLVNEIQGLSNPRDDLKHLPSLLKKQEGSLSSLPSSRLRSILDQLDPFLHSLGYLYVLKAYTSAVSISKQQASGLVSTIARFIDSCEGEQIRLVPDKFISVCRRLKDELLLLKMPMRGVAPLRTAIYKLQPSFGKLTTLHPDFLLLCLSAKCYKTGYSILEEDIFETDQPRDLFLYCYYGRDIGLGELHFTSFVVLQNDGASFGKILSFWRCVIEFAIGWFGSLTTVNRLKTENSYGQGWSQESGFGGGLEGKAI